MEKKDPVSTPAPLLPARPSATGKAPKPAPAAARAAAPAPPQPARVDRVPHGEERSPKDAETEEAVVEVGGRSWRVTVAGRSRGGSSLAPTNLLLLRFSDGEAPSSELERLVVGRGLSDLSHAQLCAALAGAAPPPDPDRQTALFAGASERRTRRG